MFDQSQLFKSLPVCPSGAKLQREVFMKKAYGIVARESIQDAVRIQAYVELAPKDVHKYGAKF